MTLLTVGPTLPQTTAAVFSLLAFGTVWFWILFAVLIIGITILVEKDDDNPGGATFFLAAAFALYYFFGMKEQFNTVFQFLFYNPGTAIGFILLYSLIGVVWSVAKWFFYVKKLVDEKCYDFENKVQPSNNKSRITGWMIYWPLSAAWTLINDPVRKFFNMIFEQFEGIYESISERALRNARK